MEKAKVTPKDFFLWAGAMIALYWSVIAFVFLIFNYINYAYPDPLLYFASDPYQSGVGYEMASIIVLFPLYVILMWFIRNAIAKDASRKEVWVRRWALILTIFVAGLTLAIDLIQLLTKFFNGEAMTTAFLLKALVVFLVAAGGLMHFLADYWGYWDQFKTRKRAVCSAVVILAAASVIAGFFILGTPQQAREYRFDDQRVSDLQGIQSQIVTYWQQKQALPAALSDLNDSISGYHVPADPETGAAYTYQPAGAHSFELCAVFAAATRPYASDTNVAMAPTAGGNTSDSWYHGAGSTCFQRAIDALRYPPLSKPATQ